MIKIQFLLNIAAIVLLVIGLWGLTVVRAHLMLILIVIELILFSIIINLIVSSSVLDDITGQLFSLLLLTIAASESALGLAIIVSWYQIGGSLNPSSIAILKS